VEHLGSARDGLGHDEEVAELAQLRRGGSLPISALSKWSMLAATRARPAMMSRTSPSTIQCEVVSDRAG